VSAWWIGEGELKEEQKEVVDIPPDKNFLLLGPPGSGKTNLLLLRANYLYLSDYPNLSVIVFTRTLREFIAMGAQRYDFPVDKVVTSTKWQRDLLGNYGIGVPVFGPKVPFDEKRVRLSELIHEEIVVKLGLKDIFDAVLLDEAHDYTPAEIDMFRTLSKVFVASADNRQKLYRTADCMDALTSATGKTVELKHHYRVGRKICRVADAIGTAIPDYVPMLDNCQYDEDTYPSDVVATQSGDIDQQAAAIVESIGLQLEAYPEEMIGVLAARHEEAGRVYEALAQSPHAGLTVRHGPNDHPDFSDDTRVCVTSIHSAKGLEFRAVHIVDADRLSRESKKLSFTAITRAKTIVNLHYHKNLPGFIDSAIRAIQPARPLPKVSRLFGRKATK
jgi:superfamily I DNA/RNA helicase